MENKSGQRHRYRLVLADDAIGPAQRIELEASNALRAMSLVQRSLREREVELYEDEQLLGKLLCNASGTWTVIPFNPERPEKDWAYLRVEAHASCRLEATNDYTRSPDVYAA